VLQLLHDRGLLPPAVAENATLVRQVRDTASDLVISAMNFLGVPYRRGGNSPDQGFDCSGFTRHIFERSLGLVLPRRADEQARQAGLLAVDRDELKPGDLVFFNTMRRAFSHVGIYVGEGKFIHAPRSGGACAGGGHARRPTGPSASMAPAAPSRPTPAPRRRSLPGTTPAASAGSRPGGTIEPDGRTIIPLADLRYAAAVPRVPAAQPAPAVC
jgi:hypothetical protein